MLEEEYLYTGTLITIIIIQLSPRRIGYHWLRLAKKTSVNMNNIEPFHQAYTYDTGNNLVTSVCFGELVKGVIVVPM
jgi:hypothetical protein